MEIDRGNIVGTALIDFREGFDDPMNHPIMQLKLQGIGLANNIAV